jgi:hypothetical protein
LFYTFLSKEYNESSLQFVEMIQELEKVPFPEKKIEAIQRATEIMKKFVYGTDSKFGHTLKAVWEQKGQRENTNEWVIDQFENPAQVFYVFDSLRLSVFCTSQV